MWFGNSTKTRPPVLFSLLRDNFRDEPEIFRFRGYLSTFLSKNGRLRGLNFEFRVKWRRWTKELVHMFCNRIPSTKKMLPSTKKMLPDSCFYTLSPQTIRTCRVCADGRGNDVETMSCLRRRTWKRKDLGPRSVGPRAPFLGGTENFSSHLPPRDSVQTNPGRDGHGHVQAARLSVRVRGSSVEASGRQCRRSTKVDDTGRKRHADRRALHSLRS